MLGNILGDIIGSRFEFMSTQEIDVKLFHRACSWTDDTVLTYAVSKVCSKIKENDSDEVIEKIFVEEFKKVVKEFPMAGWGKKFFAWATSSKYCYNDSAGNGCLMRISPIIFYFKDLETVQRIGKICTKVSHNHPDSYKCVEVFLEILYYLFHSVSDKKLIENIDFRKKKVKEIIVKYGVILETVQKYHEIAGYWGLAKDTLPRALAGYLESDSYHGAMKNMLYMGSDTDTTATIAGSMSELTYSLSAEDVSHIYRYFDHKSFYMVTQICGQYINNPILFVNLFNELTQAKIKELYNHKPIDQTAQWDPLEIPSDEDYYKCRNKFSIKIWMLKLFGRY